MTAFPAQLMLSVWISVSLPEPGAVCWHHDYAGAMREAEAEGMRNHGLGYLPVYCRHLRIGKVDGRAVPVWSRPAPGIVAVDAALLEPGEV